MENNMSNNLGQKEIAPNGGQYQPKYEGFFNEDGSYTIRRQNVACTLIGNIVDNDILIEVKKDNGDMIIGPLSIIKKDNKFKETVWYLIELITHQTSNYFVSTFDKKLPFWAINKIKKVIGYHVVKFTYAQYAKLHPNLPELIKAYRQQHKYIPDVDYYNFFYPIFNRPYLVKDYCRFPLYRLLYNHFINMNLASTNTKKEIVKILLDDNWLNLLIGHLKLPPFTKKIISKRYWVYQTIPIIFHTLPRMKKTPETKKELWCYDALLRFANGMIKDYPCHKRINKYLPSSVRSSTKTDTIKGYFDHIIDSNHDLWTRYGNQIENWSWERLVRESDNYHANIIRGKNHSKFTDNTSWPEKIVLESSDPTIKITPLLTAKSLREESNKMRHCVGGDNYIRQCLDGDTRIFHIEQGEEKATLELEHSVLSDVTMGLSCITQDGVTISNQKIDCFVPVNWKIQQIKGPCNQLNKLTHKFNQLFSEGKIKILEKIDGPDLIINKKEKSLCMNHC